LTRVLGVEEFGNLILAQSIALLFAAPIEYGFGLSTTRSIAVARGNIQEITNLVSNTVSAKIYLTVISVILFGIAYSFNLFDKVSGYTIEILLLFTVSGWSFLWFYRGIEKTYYSVIIELIGKVFFTVCVFLFISDTDDGKHVLQFQILMLVITISLSFLILKKWIAELTISMAKGLETLIADGPLFIFKGLASIHANIPIIVVSYFLSAQYFGLFTASFKLSKQLIAALSGPFWDALYPSMSRYLNIKESSSKIFKIFIISLLFGMLYGLSVYMFAEDFVLLIFGDDFSQSSSLLRILALACPIITVNISLINILISQKYERLVNVATAVNIIILIAMFVFVIAEYGELSSTWIIVFTELILLAELLIIYKLKSNAQN
jgi:PST family polysaccharide transporter